MTAARGKACDKGGIFAFEFRIVRPDGPVRWVAMRVEVFLGPDGKPRRIISAPPARRWLTARRNWNAALPSAPLRGPRRR